MTHWFDFSPTPDQLMLPIKDFDALISSQVEDLVKRCKGTSGRFRIVERPQGVPFDAVRFGGICVGVVCMNSESGPSFRVGVCYR